ncbi:hypothetical protein [Mycolicibacterium sp.]|uniref:hypothetical protein n=1 Tax=Mycolicibacterium sp. TaxID=2320850 RepID=UPI00355F043B
MTGKALVLVGAACCGSALAAILAGNRTVFALAALSAAVCVIAADFLEWEQR